MSKSLRWRFEYKYRIPRLTAEALVKILPQLGFLPDSNARDGAYPVSSIYFDSPGLDDYYDKAGGLLKRKKIRARIYEPWQSDLTDKIKLEIKWRKDLRIAKEFATIHMDGWELLRAGKYRELLQLPATSEEKSTLRGILAQIVRDSMHPQIIVRYLRRPFILNQNEVVRVNLDYSLTACQKSDFCYTPFVTRVLPPEEIIFEVKFNTLFPSGLSDVIRGFNLNRISFSKYLESVDAVRRSHPLPR